MSRFITTGNIIKGNECTIESEIEALEKLVEYTRKYFQTEEGCFALIEIAKNQIRLEIIKDLIEDLRTERRKIVA